MTRRTLTAAMVFAYLMHAAHAVEVQPGEQLANTLTVTSTAGDAGEVEVPLLLYVPADYSDEGQAWPLVLFLHGYGECGDGSPEQLSRVAIHGPASQAAAGRALPFVLATPQCPKPTERREVVVAWKPEVLLPLLDQLEAELNIDTSRVYVTGLSMGGYGTWRLAAAAPERFAAAVPICGGGDPATMAEPLAKLPVWAFHGGKDNTVPPERSQEMVEAIRVAGGAPRLTIYPEAGHNSWSATYDNPMFYDWLLGNRKP